MVLALPHDEPARAPHRYLRTPVPLHFPEEECLSDSDEHFERRVLLWESVRLALGDQALVSSDQFVYFDPTNPERCLSPDLAVRLGTPGRRIKTWKTWEWGPPQVGVEIVSPSDSPRRVMLGKLERYRQAGILEAVRFEPETEATAEQQGLNFILKDLAANEYLRESARLAELIQTQLGTVNPGGDRGVKQAGFMVLTTARRPAVLVEMGYSTNPSDAKLMTNKASQQRMASAIADAVVGYLSDYERKMGDDS